jgi:hypothetical protein
MSEETRTAVLTRDAFHAPRPGARPLFMTAGSKVEITEKDAIKRIATIQIGEQGPMRVERTVSLIDDLYADPATYTPPAPPTEHIPPQNLHRAPEATQGAGALAQQSASVAQGMPLAFDPNVGAQATTSTTTIPPAGSAPAAGDDTGAAPDAGGKPAGKPKGTRASDTDI